MGLNIEDHFEEIVEVTKLHLLPLLLIFAVLMTQKHVTQTRYEQLAFYWFLFSGAIIHITWDGFVGGLQQCHPFHRAYTIMDNRYKTRANMVKILCYFELFIFGPLCLYTARLFLNSRGIKRDLFSFASSLFQFGFASFFFIDEILNNFANVCPEESCFTFSINNIAFFWSSFIIFYPIIILFPLYNMIVAYNNLVAQERWTFQTCAIENKTGETYFADYDRVEKVPKAKKVKKE